MDMAAIKSMPNGDKKSKSWAKTSRVGDWTKEIRVEQIENGYLICLDEYGEKNGKYTSNYRKYFSKENPLSEDDMVLDTGMDEAINSFLTGM
jgi:hypothetical protein